VRVGHAFPPLALRSVVLAFFSVAQPRSCAAARRRETPRHPSAGGRFRSALWESQSRQSLPWHLQMHECPLHADHSRRRACDLTPAPGRCELGHPSWLTPPPPVPLSSAPDAGARCVRPVHRPVLSQPCCPRGLLSTAVAEWTACSPRAAGGQQGCRPPRLPTRRFIRAWASGGPWLAFNSPTTCLIRWLPPSPITFLPVTSFSPPWAPLPPSPFASLLPHPLYHHGHPERRHGAPR